MYTAPVPGLYPEPLRFLHSGSRGPRKLALPRRVLPMMDVSLAMALTPRGANPRSSDDSAQAGRAVESGDPKMSHSPTQTGSPKGVASAFCTPRSGGVSGPVGATVSACRQYEIRWPSPRPWRHSTQARPWNSEPTPQNTFGAWLRYCESEHFGSVPTSWPSHAGLHMPSELCEVGHMARQFPRLPVQQQKCNPPDQFMLKISFAIPFHVMVDEAVMLHIGWWGACVDTAVPNVFRAILARATTVPAQA